MFEKQKKKKDYNILKTTTNFLGRIDCSMSQKYTELKRWAQGDKETVMYMVNINLACCLP